jgi:hypothetical protein
MLIAPASASVSCGRTRQVNARPEAAIAAIVCFLWNIVSLLMDKMESQSMEYNDHAKSYPIVLLSKYYLAGFARHAKIDKPAKNVCDPCSYLFSRK